MPDTFFEAEPVHSKHESKDGNRVYNQFNSRVTYPNNKLELPNFGSPSGWGMAQIDKGTNHTDTALLYNWKYNIQQMNETLRQKKIMYERFISYYREAYSNNPNVNWSEPTTATKIVNGEVVTAFEWGVMTLYNGAEGISRKTVGNYSFSSPIHFNPSTSKWQFLSNKNDYARKVVEDSKTTESE